MFFPLAANYNQSTVAAVGGGFLISVGTRTVRPSVPPSLAQPSHTVSVLLSAGCRSDAFTINSCCRNVAARRPLHPPAARPNR